MKARLVASESVPNVAREQVGGIVSEADFVRGKQKEGASPPVEPVQSATSESAPAAGEPQPKSTDITLSQEEFQRVIAVAAEQIMTEVRAENLALREQLETATRKSDSLSRVFETLGKTGPMLNTQLSNSRDRFEGLAADFDQALNHRATVWVDPNTAERVLQRDWTGALELYRTDRNALRKSLQELGRQHGMFVSSNAPTTAADIPGVILSYLSLVMRETHSARFVYWQFPVLKIEQGRGPGDTMLLPRVRFLTEPQAPADRDMTNLATTAGRSPIQANTVPALLREWGNLAGTANGGSPVAIPEFLSAVSLLDLENAVLSILGHDYLATEDLLIRSVYFSTTRILYNYRDTVVPLVAMAATAGGTMTERFLVNLYAYMSGLQILTYDGYFIIVLNDTAAAQLRNDMGERFRYHTPEEAQELSSILALATGQNFEKVSGYLGTYCGFRVFTTNAHSVGTVAALNNGVTYEPVSGVGSLLFRTSLAFGRGAVGRGVTLPAEIRMEDSGQFGRQIAYGWKDHEAVAPLDVDPLLNAAQQLRVIEVRTLDLAI